MHKMVGGESNDTGRLFFGSRTGTAIKDSTVLTKGGILHGRRVRRIRYWWK